MASLIVDDSATAIYCVSHSFSLGRERRERAADGVTFQNAKPPQSAPLAESGAQTKAKTSLSLMKVTSFQKAECILAKVERQPERQLKNNNKG